MMLLQTKSDAQMNLPVNENHELIMKAVQHVIDEAKKYDYECTLNAFHLQLMLDCYVNGMDPVSIIDQMLAGYDTNLAFRFVINN